MKRVVIDGRMVGPVPHGFSRYVCAMAQGLKKLEQEGQLAYDPVFLVQPGVRPAAFAGFTVCDVGARFLSPMELLEIPRLLKRLGASLYHSPTFSSLKWAPCPWVVTVHDLNHLRFGGIKEKLYYEHLLKPFVKKAAAVATVSETSRQQIAPWAGLGPTRIDLVYNAIDPTFAERVDPSQIQLVLARYGLTAKKYFFSLSNSKPHKNLKMLVDAFARYRVTPAPAGGHWDLVLNLNPSEMSKTPGLRLIGAPSDQDARALLAGAGAVAFPSLYEGFGLPAVEAACLGVPLLASRIPAHREALADLEQGEVLWLEASDAAAWAHGMARATAGEVLGASFESRSKLQRRFSVLKMGAHMDRIYRRVLGIQS